jgi:hypothetical protein
MQPVKRVEIITGAASEFAEVEKVLRAFGIGGYVVHHDVIGRGDRRVESIDPLTGDMQNTMIQTSRAPDRVDPLVESLRPIIWRFGGACVVYDAECLVF